MTTPAAPAAPATPPVTPEPGATGAGSIPAVTPPAPAVIDFPEIGKITPPEFKDKPWVGEIKDVPSLFKKVDWLQTKLGERPAGIPQDTAPKEEWDKFYAAFGRPEKPDAYQFGAVPEGLQVDENFQKEIKNVMFAAGVNGKQAKILEEGYNKLLLQSVEGQKGKAAEQDKQFIEMTTKVFGQEKDQALKIAKALIDKHTSTEVKPYLAGLPNEALIVMADTLRNIQKTYIREDQLPTGAGSGVGPVSQEQRRAEGQKLMASEAYTNAFHPEHEATVKKVRELYGTA